VQRQLDLASARTVFVKRQLDLASARTACVNIAGFSLSTELPPAPKSPRRLDDARKRLAAAEAAKASP